MDEYCVRAAIVARYPFTFSGPNSSVSLKPRESAYIPLRATHHPNLKSATRWRERIPPIIKRIVTDIESLRNNNWLRNSNRNPVILPPRLRLQSLLLPYPHLDDSKSQHYKIFAMVINTLVKECAGSASCVSDFSYLLESIELVIQSDKIPSTLAIWEMNDQDHTQRDGCLKLQVASKLLNDADKDERESSAEVRELVKRWKGSPSEWARKMAWEIDPKV